MITEEYLKDHFFQPLFDVWLELAVAAQVLDLPNYELDPDKYRSVHWMFRGWSWVDPQKEVAACKEAIKAGFKTQAQIIAEQGGDIHEVMAARKNEVELAEQLGLNFDVNMSSSPDNIATQGNIEESNTEYAIGCTYKFLNCGPGSPAFIYVNRKKIKEINSPINGWFSHENPFDFKQKYSQTQSIEKFRSGTPHILSMSTMIDSLNITLLAGTKNIDIKREKMINFFNQLFKSYLESRNFKFESPKDLSIIGSHVTISHSESWRICKSLINPQKGKKIIVDFRPNNYLRIAITPLYTSFDEILKLVVRLVEILDTGEFKLHDNSREIVT